MGWGSLGNELVNSMGQPKGQQAQKTIRGKDVVIGLRKLMDLAKSQWK